ncbi:MAG: GIY-YIG nuclease family protein [Candidatus Moranbacteria bacterium]|nr:GIY-YIG nuclease family protein [Candidatus Moranbacteria bacterium]
MYYAYVLESLKNKRFYVGSTVNLKKRFLEHNRKKGGKYSSKNGPFKLVFYEVFLNKKDALKAENFFKTGYGREVLKDKLENYLRENLGNSQVVRQRVLVP